MIKNKCGYELIEFISCAEEEIEKFENVTGAGVVFQVGDKYLIGFNNWRKQWEIPAGRIENGEKARETAIRELAEETHQKVDNFEFKVLVKKKRPNGEIVYNAIFLCEEDKIKPFFKNDEDENDEITLWDLKKDVGDVDEIDTEIIKFVKNIIRK